LLRLFPSPPARGRGGGGVGRRLNNAWHRFAGPQISSSARSPQDASTPFLVSTRSLVCPYTTHPFPSPLRIHLAGLSRTQGPTFIILVKIGDRFCRLKW
jgi:hypothetical protein